MLLTETSVPLVAGSDAAALPYFGTDAPRGSRAPPVALLSHLQRHEVGCKAQQPDAHTHVFGCWGRPATHWCQAASPRPWAHSPHLCPQTAGKPSHSNNSLPSLLSPFFFFLFFLFPLPFLRAVLRPGSSCPRRAAKQPPTPTRDSPAVRRRGVLEGRAGGGPGEPRPCRAGGSHSVNPPLPPQDNGRPDSSPWAGPTAPRRAAGPL